MTFLWFDYTFISFGSISPIFSHIFKRSMVKKWHQPGFTTKKKKKGNESGTAKNCYLMIWLCVLSILGQFHPFLVKSFNAQWWQSGISWNSWQEFHGNGNESGTAKRCYLCDLIMLLSILGQFHPSFFCQIFKCSMVTKWNQPESIAGNGNELATGKKMPCLRSDYAIINLGQFHPFLVKF